MAIPPKGDPRRSVHLAARSCYVLGALGLIPLLFVIPLLISQGFRPAQMTGWTFGLVFEISPGVTLLLCGYFIKHRKLWAVIVALVLSSLCELYCVLMATLFGWSLVEDGSFSIGTLILVGVILFLLAAFGQLIYYLVKSVKGIRLPPIGLDQGFEPILFANRVGDPPTLSEDRA